MAATRQKKTKKVVLHQHHSKPFRKRQLLALALALLLLITLALQTGITIGRTQPGTAPAVAASAGAANASSLRSSYGFALAYDSNAFEVSATLLDAAGNAILATQSQLNDGLALAAARIKPQEGTVARLDAASQLSLQFGENSAAFTQARNNPVNAGLSNEAVAAQLFPVTSTGELDATVVSSRPATLGTVLVQQTVYSYTPTFNGGTSYEVVWTGVVESRAFAVRVQGLVGSSAVPAAYDGILQSLVIQGEQGVRGATTTDKTAPTVSERYLSDAYSPAVVKIYNITCGALVFYGRQLTENACYGSTGSGFFMTHDGYIATNGHVVSYTAQDVFVEAITSNPSVFRSFLMGFVGMSATQSEQVINSPELLASVIAKVYDIPDSDVSFRDRQNVIMVATGSAIPNLTGLPESRDLTGFKQQSSALRQATVVGINYRASDVYAAIADPEQGFSASDVAILKVAVQDAPTISLSQMIAQQNERIIVAGFPGDADNVLTDNSEISVSVTNGNISSIRKSAGGRTTLYQSDADASHGNSGGPAINRDGDVIGLLTYRFGSTSDGNSAKSYIRDIRDISNLADLNGIDIDAASTTRTAWERALNNYATNRYSKALEDFQLVKRQYPSHRLADTYIAASVQAIADGKNVRDLPVGVLMAGATIALIALGATIFVVIRHHGHHKLYKAYQPLMPGGKPSHHGYHINLFPPHPQH